MLRLALGLGAALLAAPAWAADQPQYEPPPAWVKPLDIPKPSAKDSGSAIQLLLEDFEDYFGPDGDYAYQEYAERIQTSQGLESVGNIVLNWRPDAETLIIHKLHIIRDGQVIDVLAGGQTFLVLRRENNLEMAMLDGALTAAIQPEGLQVGDVLDLAFTLRRSDPVMQGRSQRVIRTALSIPIGHLRMREIWPKSKALQWRETEGLAAAKMTETQDGSELVVDMTDAQPPKIPKDAPARFSNVGQLEVSQFATWADISALMTPLYDKASKLAPNSPLKAEASRIMAESRDPKSRAAAALRLVQDRVRYLFLGMDNGGYIPADADRTWTRRFGDCKGKTALLLALLHEMGIEAQPALVSSTRGDGLDTWLPLAGIFDHIFVRAQIDGKTYWLDGTRTGDRSLDDLDTPRFSWALPVQSADAALVKLTTKPFDRPETSTTLHLDASAGLDAPAPAHAEQILRGDAATSIRLQLGSKSRADAESYLRSFWIDQYDWIDIKRVDFAFDEASGEEHLSMDGMAKMSWKTYRGETGRQYETDGSHLGWRADFTREPGPHQDAPFAVQYPNFVKYTETIVLPQDGAGFRIDGADVDKVVGGYAFRRGSKIEKNIFTMTASTRSIAAEFPAADAPSVKTALRELSDIEVYLIAPSSLNANQSAAAGKGGSTNPKTAASLARAGQAYMDGDVGGSAAAIEQALAADPNNVELLAARAITRLQNRDIAGAASDIDAATKLSPNSKMVKEAEASLDLVKGQTQDAMNIVGDLIRVNPQDAALYELRAHGFAMQQNKDKATADFDRAVQLAPNNPEIHLERAQFFLSVNDMNRALEDADEVIIQLPENQIGHEIRAAALGGLGRRTEAVHEYDSVIAIRPTAEAYYGRAWNRRYDDYRQALTDLDTALKMDPNLAAAYRLQGQIYFAQSNFPMAIKAFETSVRLMPGDLGAARKLAAAYAGDRQYDAAIHEIDQMLVDQPQSVSSLMERCRYKALKMQNRDDALGDCDRASKLDPESDEVLEIRAFAYERFGQIGKAMEVYNDILTRRPNSAIAHFGRAMAELDLHLSEQAKVDFVTARQSESYIDTKLANYMQAPEGYQSSNPEMRARLAAAMASTDSDNQHRAHDQPQQAAGTYTSPKPLSVVKPYYPAIAEDDEIEGYVDFKFVIEPDGSVGDAKVMAEAPEGYGLADAALKVFPKWKFLPKTVDSKPVSAPASYRFSFKLR